MQWNFQEIKEALLAENHLVWVEPHWRNFFVDKLHILHTLCPTEDAIIVHDLVTSITPSPPWMLLRHPAPLFCLLTPLTMFSSPLFCGLCCFPLCYVEDAIIPSCFMEDVASPLISGLGIALSSVFSMAIIPFLDFVPPTSYKMEITPSHCIMEDIVPPVGCDPGEPNWPMG